MSGQSSATKRTLPRGPALVAAVLLLLIGLGFAAAHFLRSHRQPSPPSSPSPSEEASDPRRSYDGPYRNIHPDVGYIGDAACAECHEDIARSYARHPMGRSLVPAAVLLDRQRDTPDTNNPFSHFGRRFEVKREGKRLWHRQALLDEAGQPILEQAQEVHWVIGSGAKGYSYLSERDGYLFQTPISWFTQKQRWDLSPGFGPDVLTGRLVPASCLFCHANQLRQHPQHPNRFVPPVFAGLSVGCERCHGPGELHAHTADRWDIVNPDRLLPQRRDAVCEQCHLEGEARIVRADRGLFDFRPGLPLNEFWAVLVQDRASGTDTKAVNHVEQMYQSKCFSRPVGTLKLGCTTCHDPHVRVGAAERATHYRAKCLLCHDEARDQVGCSESLARRKQVSPADSCIECHMPRYRSSDIAHTASTDHRIVRRPNSRDPARPEAADLDRAALVDFYRDRFADDDPQTERTLGLGLVKLMNEGRLAPERHAERAVRLLERALARDANDVAVREGKVEAFLLLQRPAEALIEAEVLLPTQPENGQLLAQAAYAAQAAGQTERAREYWRRAVEINPFEPDSQLRLLTLLLRAGCLDEAQRHCEQLMRLDPFNVSARQTWVGFLLQQGKREEARREFDLIRKLRPKDLEKREEWFRQQLR